MSFNDIVGQQKQVTLLRSALVKDRLPHAYLFLGPDGVGKGTVALALAKAIHCSERKDDFCGRCVNCHRIADANHPDVRVLEPLPGKKDISIQQIRELERDLNYRSFTGATKVAVVDPATLMNSAAQNALLKTLEEPPKDCLIILIAPQVGGLLPTLRSRCVRLSFAPLTREEVAGFLQSRHGMKEADARRAAALSMGSIGAALELQGDDQVEKRRTWIKMLISLKNTDYHGAMVSAESLASNRDEALRFLTWAQGWYRDQLILMVTKNTEELLNLDMASQFDPQSTDGDVEKTLRALAQIGAAAAGIQRNLNRRMVLEKFLFDQVRGH